MTAGHPFLCSILYTQKPELAICRIFQKAEIGMQFYDAMGWILAVKRVSHSVP